MKSKCGKAGVYKTAACGAGVGAGLGLVKGGAIGLAAFGGAVGLPLWVAGAVVGTAVAVGVSALKDAKEVLKDDLEAEDLKDDPENKP